MLKIMNIIIVIVLIIVVCIIVSFTTQKIQYKLSPVLKDYTNSEQNEDVDVVITWVDSTDIQWKHAKIEAQLKEGHTLESIRSPPPTVMVDAELSLNLLLVFKNLPWIRQIFIITWRIRDIPCLMNNPVLKYHFQSGRIKLIDQRELLAIPNNVFNSHAIETKLHYIPGLSEKFIYMNDDFFATRFIRYDMLFYQGFPVIRPQFYLPASQYLADLSLKHMPGYKKIQDYFQDKKIFFPSHHVTPLSKSIMLDAEYAFKKDWDNTTVSVFRNSKDIAPVALSLLYAIQTNKIVGYRNDPLITFYNLHANRYGEYEDRFIYMFIQMLPALQDKLNVRSYNRILKKLNTFQPHCVCFSAVSEDAKLQRTLKAIYNYAFSR